MDKHAPEVVSAERSLQRPKIKVGITHGDTNGVGYEVILKTFADSAMFDLCTPVVYGSAKVATYHKKTLELSTNFNTIAVATEAEAGRLNLVNCFDEEIKIELGKAEKESGKAAFKALERAVSDYKAGLIDVLVTAPISKAAIQSEHFPFTGHTEYLQNCFEGEALMILTNSLMRVALVTTHLPISKVAEAITKEAVEKKIELFYRSLRRDFLLPAPRIAVLGLNPHNGDEGTIGMEEQTIISPAIAELREKGIPVFGPYAADGFFGSGHYKHFDGILAMYHDQGLAPFKALSMEGGVNFTAGLSLVRTSPDHGTAYDIAGKGVASASSFREAVYAAIDIFRHRMADDEAYQKPLQKLYQDRREEGDRVRHYQQEKKQ